MQLVLFNFLGENKQNICGKVERYFQVSRTKTKLSTTRQEESLENYKECSKL